MGNSMDPQGGRMAPARTGLMAGVVAAHGVLLFGLLGALIFVVPRFEVMFRDARMALPGMTAWAVGLSNFCKTYFFGVAGIAAGLLYGDWVLCGWLRTHFESRVAVRTWAAVVLVILIGCGVWLTAALFLPFREIMQNTQESS